MSRNSTEYGNGAKCDVCNRCLMPFDTLRLVGKQLVPGKTYETCSSDTKYIHIDLFHLCDRCYKKVTSMIKERKI